MVRQRFLRALLNTFDSVVCDAIAFAATSADSQGALPEGPFLRVGPSGSALLWSHSFRNAYKAFCFHIFILKHIVFFQCKSLSSMCRRRRSDLAKLRYTSHGFRFITAWNNETFPWVQLGPSPPASPILVTKPQQLHSLNELLGI